MDVMKCRLEEAKNMKKIAILLIVLMVISVGFLSGCNQQLLEKEAITINGPNDTSISLPSNSTDSETNFSIEELNKSMVSYIPTWSNDIILLYDFSADRPIKEAVTIRIPIPDAELAVLGHYHNWNWEAVPFNEENGKAVVEVDNLSFFGWLDVSNFADKALDFFTLRWMDKEPTLTHDSNIVVDESKTYDLISGSGQLIEGNTVKITIYNNAPVHLEVYPVDYPAKSFELKKTGIYTYEEYTILGSNSYGEWTTDLVIDESVTFNAYFSDLALAAFTGDIIPFGRLGRGILESALFAKNGREMKWADIKSLLIFPTFAEAAKTVKELKDMPDALLETASIVFTRVESDEPSVTEKDLIREKLEQWLYDNRYNLSEFSSFGYAINLGVNDIGFVENHIWAAASLPGIGGYGHILHSADGGNNWEVQWKSSTYGPDPFKVIFLDVNEGFVGADDAVLHTTDGGQTRDTIWERSGFGGWLRGFDVIDREYLWCRTSSKSEFYLYTTDDGESWEVKYS